MRWRFVLALAAALWSARDVAAQGQAGSIRGVVYDADFEAPLPGARVQNVDTGQTVTTSDQGNFLFGEVTPGTYTLVFSKEGYVRQVRTDVVVLAGQLTDVDARLAGEFTEMEEFIVQDVLQLGVGTEAALLQLRFESPSLIDSISADLMSRAGASDAASALTLVAGATVQDGRFAVIRGLPDRYVSSQMNGVRLPTSDEDKRAVELDQFPAAVIGSIQVRKTFTPDQQGDASGGAVDVRLRGIPEEPLFQLEASTSYNTNVSNRSDFLSYDGGGVGDFGLSGSEKDIQYDNLGGNWTGAVGVRPEDSPTDYKLSAAFGDRKELDDGLVVGGFASLYYERDSSMYDDGIDDSYWVDLPGQGLVPEQSQKSASNQFNTSLFDVTRSEQSVQWGGLGTLGLETEKHSLGLTFLYTHLAEDAATLAEDTRGKEYFFPGYDPDDPDDPGNSVDNLGFAPYLRNETLQYSERTTSTLQLHGEHELEIGKGRLLGLDVQGSEVDWRVSRSSAKLYQPDKRQFGSLWQPGYTDPGNPVFGIPPSEVPPTFKGLKPSDNINFGNLQRTWKTIEENSEQFALNWKLPFERDGEDGYLKFGLFDDRVDRVFDQESFTNPEDPVYAAGFDEFWSAVFPDQDHAIEESLYDVDYDGKLNVSAVYGMVDMPLSPKVNVVGGLRFESTEIGVVNTADALATWFPPGDLAPSSDFDEANVDFSQDDVLPAISVEYRPTEELTLRAAFTQTVARQTFKELTPIVQQEFLGGPLFIGNPDLQMSSLDNYDLRADYEPYQGGLFSVSAFRKDVTDPIEYVQRLVTFNFTTALNYPEGRLTGYELELRQELGRFWDRLEGLSFGANATLIDSEVRFTDDEIAGFQTPAIMAPMTTRKMSFAPEHLYNLYFTYDLESTGTQLGAFYTVKGDTLVAGATQANTNFVPSIFAKEYDTLNVSLTQRLGDRWSLKLQGKNLTNPKIEEVYRSQYIGDDVTNTSYTRGRELSIGLTFSL